MTLTPWTVRRVLRWSGALTAAAAILLSLPTLWAVTYANSAIADAACRGTRGCERAYFCPSSGLSTWPHPALCMTGAFLSSEVDSGTWHDGLTNALPSMTLPLLPGTFTIRWLNANPTEDAR